MVALRSRAVSRLAGTGAMAAVELGAAEVARRLGPGVTVAADNGPRSCTVSGTAEAVDALVRWFESAGVFARRVRPDCASHCARVEACGTGRGTCEGLSPGAASGADDSTVTGERLEGPELGGSYWYRNLREAVRFRADDGADRERTDPTLRGGEPASQPDNGTGKHDETAGWRGRRWGPLRRGRRRRERLLVSLGQLHLSRARGRLGEGDGAVSRADGALATYPFQRTRYWLRRPARHRRAGAGTARIRCSGRVIEVAGTGVQVHERGLSGVARVGGGPCGRRAGHPAGGRP